MRIRSTLAALSTKPEISLFAAECDIAHRAGEAHPLALANRILKEFAFLQNKFNIHPHKIIFKVHREQLLRVCTEGNVRSIVLCLRFNLSQIKDDIPLELDRCAARSGK